MFRHVIFDFDMTLVDSLSSILLGLNKMAAHFRLPPVTDRELKPAMHLEAKALWSRLWGSYDEAWFAFFRAEVEAGENPPLAPGALDILRRLKKSGFSLALVTNRDRPWDDLAAIGLAPFFDAAVGVLDAPRGKPAPDMLLSVLEQFKADPAQTAYIGDAPTDMAAAAQAGLRGIGLLAGSGAGREELLAAGAWRIRNDLYDLDDLFW